MKRLIYIIFFIFILQSISFSYSIDISLKFSPQKTVYSENENISLLFSCTPNSENVYGDIYIVFYTPDKKWYSVTLTGIKKGIVPIASNIKIPEINNVPVFNFPYLSIFKNGDYKILSAIIDSNSKKIISNIYTLDIPGEETTDNSSSSSGEITDNNSTSQENLLTWNPLKKIYNDYQKPFFIKSGKNFIHVLTYKTNHEMFYYKFDKNGNIITADYKLPFKYHASPDYLPAVVVDNNDNVYLIYYSSSEEDGMYLCKISNKGTIEFNKLFLNWKSSYAPKHYKATIYGDKIYFTGFSSYITIQDKNDYNKKTVYYRNIFFSAITTDGEVIIKPSPISAQVKEYYRGKKVNETDEIYPALPNIIADNNGNIHVFWNERDVDLKTNYYLKYMRFNPKKGTSILNTLAEIGKNHSYLSLMLDNNTIYIGFINSKESPRKISVLKLSDNGELIKGASDISSDVGNAPFFILKKNENILVAYYYNQYFYSIVVNSDIDKIVENSEKVFDKKFFYGDFCEDSSGNYHFVGADFGSNKYLYYSNTLKNGNYFVGLSDIVVSESHFTCSPSNNVDINKSISCSFKIYNISDNSSSNGKISVNISNKEIFSESISEMSAFSNKEFTFKYSPTDINTPEYPSVSIVASGFENEVTSVNNIINPVIRVRPVPVETDFKVQVYDESFDPEHNFVLPKLSDVTCKLYDKSGEYITSDVNGEFKNISFGESSSLKKEFLIKCEKQNFNQATENIYIWRDDNNPYKIDFSPEAPVAIYMNSWGSLSVNLNYLDKNNNEKSLTNYDLYISGQSVTRHYNVTDSTFTVSTLPAGSYNIKIEKENYSQVSDTAEIYVGGFTSKDYTTEQTEMGEIEIKLSSDAGYIPSNATLKFIKGDKTTTINIENGYYSGEIEKGYYKIEVTANNFKTYSKNVTIKAGLDNEISILLEASTPSNLKSYSRSEDVAVVPFAIIAEWPSTPATDGFKVKTMLGVFQINANFLGQEKDNKIYSIKQLSLSVKGLGAYYYSVSSTWDPVDILDLPDLVQDVYDAYGTIPFAITPEIPIGIAGATGKTKIRIDKIVINDDQGNTLAQFKPTLYSDSNTLFDINKILDENVSDFYTEIYLKVGKQDSLNEFKDIDTIDGYNAQYLKITYTVPVLKPDSGWYFYNPVTGNESKVTSKFRQSASTSYLIGTIKYKAFEPYKIDLNYILPDDYTQNVLGIPSD